MKIDINVAIRTWLLNGVTFAEIQERLGWLGVPMTFEEIKKIAGIN